MPGDLSFQTFLVLLVGDSWPAFMWQDQTLRAVFAGHGYPGFLEKGDVTTIAGSRASEWATPPFLQLLTDELAAHPTVRVVQLTVGGNDFLAGLSGGGWYLGMPPEDEDALFDSIAGDVEAVVDHLLDLDPELRVLVSGYDYPNFVESLEGPLAFFCIPYWEDLGEPDPLDINSASTRLTDRIEDRLAARSRVLTVRHLGLMQFVFGYPSLEIPPGELTPPGDLTLPSPPEAMRFFQSDCIHLDPDGHLAVGEVLWQTVYRSLLTGIFTDGFESADLSAWSLAAP